MSNTDILLRAFVSADQAPARRLILEGLGEHFGFIDETLNPDLDDIAANYLAQGHLFLVAECRQALVGTGALLVRPDLTGELVRVSTHCAYRRQGIARVICRQLIERGRQRGLRKLFVQTNLDWDGAISLYQQMGFVEYERTEAGVRMVRRLS